MGFTTTHPYKNYLSTEKKKPLHVISSLLFAYCRYRNKMADMQIHEELLNSTDLTSKILLTSKSLNI